MSKALRHQQILKIVGAGHVSSQDDLRLELLRRNLRVTQTTLSRDIHELGLLKASDGYTQPGSDFGVRSLPSPNHLLREFAVDLHYAGQMVIIRTKPGSAHPVAAALDSAGWKEILGTVAGDDTILVVTGSPKAGKHIFDRLREVVS